jgi:Kef-type K+ transport system membrane component KefB
MAELSITFFLEMALILAACRVVGWLGRKLLKQPQVVGEMIAGILLGPSLFGVVAPVLHEAVFPAKSQGVLYVGAQLSVALYMFLVRLRFGRTNSEPTCTRRPRSRSPAWSCRSSSPSRPLRG